LTAQQTAAARTDDVISDGLAAWFASRAGAPELRIAGISRNPNNGFSNDSIFLDVEHGGGIQKYVVRIPPRAEGLLEDFDLERQARVQHALADAGLPTVKPVAFESDERWIGAPFLVMPLVVGRVPPDEPHYSQSGWVFDLGAERQRELYRQALQAMAEIQLVDWSAASFLARAGGPTLAAEFKWWEDYIIWAAAGDIPEPVVLALQWLKDNFPATEPGPSVVWGDARLGNIIFGEGEKPVAVLDWENASIGPAEVDIGYFLAYERRNRVRFNNDSERELPGFLSREETLDFFESKLGRRLQNIEWYEVFGIVRIAGFMVRVQNLMRARGQHNHFVMKRPLIQPWVVELMASAAKG